MVYYSKGKIMRLRDYIQKDYIQKKAGVTAVEVLEGDHVGKKVDLSTNAKRKAFYQGLSNKPIEEQQKIMDTYAKPRPKKPSGKVLNAQRLERSGKVNESPYTEEEFKTTAQALNYQKKNPDWNYDKVLDDNAENMNRIKELAKDQTPEGMAKARDMYNQIKMAMALKNHYGNVNRLSDTAKRSAGWGGVDRYAHNALNMLKHTITAGYYGSNIPDQDITNPDLRGAYAIPDASAKEVFEDFLKVKEPNARKDQKFSDQQKMRLGAAKKEADEKILLPAQETGVEGRKLVDEGKAILDSPIGKKVKEITSDPEKSAKVIKGMNAAVEAGDMLGEIVPMVKKYGWIAAAGVIGIPVIALMSMFMNRGGGNQGMSQEQMMQMMMMMQNMNRPGAVDPAFRPSNFRG